MVVLLMIFRSSFGMIFVIGNIFMIWLLILLSKKYTETGHRFVKWIRAIGIIGYSLFILSFIFVESFILYELQECKKLNLEEIGIKEDRIYYENQSTSTYENLKFSKRIMEELRIQHPTVLIVTSDYHTVRATMIANELGIKSECLSSDSPFFIKVNYFIREYFALVKHYVTKV